MLTESVRRRVARPVSALAVALTLTLLAAVDRPALALEIIDSAGGVIYIEVNKGRLLRLDEAPATVFLANPEIADLQLRTSRLVYLHGKATGETSLFALNRGDEVLLNRKIVVGYDLDQLNAAIEQLVPNAGISASMVNNALVLDGVVGSPAEAEAIREIARTFTNGGPLLNRLKVSMPNQINLRVKIAEVNRNVDKEFGFDYDIFGDDFQFATFLTSGRFSGTVSTGLRKTLGSFSIEAFLNALESEGLVSILAEPNLTALSGETASFLAGGEFPFSTVDSEGNINIEFKPFGVSLAFTPTLLDDQRISMNVRPEVSQVTSDAQTIAGQTLRGINTRRAETTVELGNGESLVLAGLLQKNIIEDLDKVPGLADIPILGTLFRSQAFQQNETELMIIVTPYIVKPTRDRVALPTDGLEPANEYERVVWGALYRDSTGPMPDRVARNRGHRLVGPVGFQLE